LVVHHRPASGGPGAQSSPATVGFVVSRAVGNSVVRHRVTRRLRHVVRERLAELPGGSTTVVRALPASAGADFAVLAADFATAVQAVRRSRP
jgi:ribonuclease P protein component